LKRSPWPKPLQQPLSLLSPMAALAAVVAALVAPNHRPNNHSSVPFSRHSNSNNLVVNVAVSGGTKKPRTTPPRVLPQAVVAPPLLVAPFPLAATRTGTRGPVPSSCGLDRRLDAPSCPSRRLSSSCRHPRPTSPVLLASGPASGASLLPLLLVPPWRKDGISSPWRATSKP